MSKIHLLFEYHNWSINRMLSYIEELDTNLFHEQVTSVFSSIRETCEHIYSVDQTWFNRMKKGEHSTDVSFQDVQEARQEINRLHEEMMIFLKESEWSQTIGYQNSTGTTFENMLEDLVTHIVNHGTYHKGNITAMLWSLGHRSIATDYIVFLREKKHQDGVE